MSIDEKNAVIAKFMGYKVFIKRYPRNHGIGAPETELKDCILEKLKYHSSWDSLIPVVKQIQELKLFNFEHKKPVMNALMSVDIKELHEAVFNFINNDL